MIYPKPTFAQTGTSINANINANIHSQLISKQKSLFSTQRQLYQQALTALSNKHNKTYRKLKSQLTTYPLHLYLTYKEITAQIKSGKAKTKEVKHFLKQNQDTPLEKKLRTLWLSHLGHKKHWKQFLKFYQPSSNRKMKCFYYTALLKQKKYEQAYTGAKILWLVGHSQPDACDTLFATWIKSSAFKSKYYWERAQIALSQKNFQLAQYLSKSMHKAQKEKTQLWIKTYRQPMLLKNSKLYQPAQAVDQQIILMGLQKLLRQDTAAFEQIWPTYRDKITRTSKHYQTFSHFVARWYSYHYDPKAWGWLHEADPKLQDYELIQRRIRMSLKEQDWARLHAWLLSLPLQYSQELSWQYWLCRAELEQIKKNAISQLTVKLRLPPTAIETPIEANLQAPHQAFISRLLQATPINNNLNEHWHLHNRLLNLRDKLETLSETRSFYGFLASNMLNKQLSLNYAKYTSSTQQLQHIIKQPGITRALELFLLKDFPNARSEWIYATNGFSKQKKSVAAKIAHLWGWDNQAIHTAAFSSHKDDLNIRFPQAYKDQVIEHARKNGLSEDWIFSLIRQESAFMPDARSSVGALGLMQIMPRTAQHIARNNGYNHSGKYALLNPKHNIKFGTSYLAELLEQLDGSLPMATAAYNAGLRRAKNWRPITAPEPGDIWVETIPIRETREYVKNIMTYQAIYRHHLNQAVQLSSTLNTIHPKQR